MAESKHRHVPSTMDQKSFVERLAKVHPDSLDVFNAAAQKPFKDQACFFLNAFWAEFGEYKEFIYAVIYPIFKLADMQQKGVSLVYAYDEGCDLDFDMGLYAFEQLNFFQDNPTDLRFKQFDIPKWVTKHQQEWSGWASTCIPPMKTALERKKELREKVDVNFDNRVSLLEFLLYQFEADPVQLMERSMAQPDEHPAITQAREALAAVQEAVKAYEMKKQTLIDISQNATGVKALRARNELAQLVSSPEWERLNAALITAEAKVRIAVRKFGAGNANPADFTGDQLQPRTFGSVWWMQRELQDVQERYGKKQRA